jgi:hypothetical protein
MNDKQLRELDAWIAENVMGEQPAFTVMKDGYYYRPQACGYTKDIQKAWRCTKTVAESELVCGEIMNVVPIPPLKYTTDPAAAMMVLEKCGEKISPKRILVWKLSPPNFKHCWFVCTTEKRGEAETLPLAICLFAKQLFIKS